MNTDHLRRVNLENGKDAISVTGAGHSAAACLMLAWCGIDSHDTITTPDGKLSRRMTGAARFLAGAVRAGGGEVVTPSRAASAEAM